MGRAFFDSYSKEKIEELIAAVNALGSGSSSVEDYRAFAEKLLSEYVTVHKIPPAGFQVYRVRKMDDKPSVRSDVGCPPPEFITRYGRLNRPGQSVFYASLARTSACFEVRPVLGDWLAISRWRINSPLLFSWIGYSTTVLNRLGSAEQDEFTRSFEKVLGNKPLLLTRHNFIAEAFSRHVKAGHEDEYKISIGLAEKLLAIDISAPVESFKRKGMSFGENQSIGFIYPALAMSGNADNLMTTETMFRRHFTLEEVEWAQVIEWKDPLHITLGVRDKSFAITSDDAIQWLRGA